MEMGAIKTPPPSARPEMTAALMAETGLNADVLRDLVHRFYGRVRADAVLGPIFAARITDWAPHLDRMVDFWCSVALMTGQYHGRPVPAHTPLPINAAHFDRWLALFRATATDTCGRDPCHRARRTHRQITAHRRGNRASRTCGPTTAVLTRGEPA